MDAYGDIDGSATDRLSVATGAWSGVLIGLVVWLLAADAWLFLR